jgi:putative transposase
VSVKRRQALLEKDGDMSLSHQCSLLSLNRSTLYYKPAPPSAMELLIKQVIDYVYTRKPIYGYRRITQELGEVYGLWANPKTILKYMGEMGIQALYPKPNLSKAKPEHTVYPYLLKGLAITHPNQVWSTDITYIPILGGFMYLTAVIDWYSRYVLDWQLSATLEEAFIEENVKQALKRGKPEIMNSDQGSQYTSPKYTNLLKEAQVRISMDHRGRCYDNIFIERLWRSVKYELIYINEFKSPRELRNALKEYFQFYNEERYHQSLNYRPPQQVHFEAQRDE